MWGALCEKIYLTATSFNYHFNPFLFFPYGADTFRPPTHPPIRFCPLGKYLPHVILATCQTPFATCQKACHLSKILCHLFTMQINQELPIKQNKKKGEGRESQANTLTQHTPLDREKREGKRSKEVRDFSSFSRAFSTISSR
jgi:hypothetical protein